MKKGKINLLSFADDNAEEEEVNFSKKPQKSSYKETDNSRPPLDLSQIKDRVIQMELDEEMIIEGEVAEALFTADNDKEEEAEDLSLLQKIKEAKSKRREAVNDSEELPDYIPISTKGDYWLMQDTKESEETFKTSTSRLVREDLFNEIEVDDGSAAFTSFYGKSEGRGGLMMTKKMLERDIKSDLYDLEISEMIEDAEVDGWERVQVLKGIEKGWNRTDDEANFYSKQAKMSNFVPPSPIEEFDQSLLEEIDTNQLEGNLKKISDDSKRLEEKIKELETDIDATSKSISSYNEIETFFMRCSRFLSEKLPELNEINDKERWEHFFDNVDIEDSDLLDLPDIINKAKSILGPNFDGCKELTELFIKYHFMAMDFDPPSDPKTIWESSGLKDALNSIEDPLELLRQVYVDDLEKFELIERVIFQQ